MKKSVSPRHSWWTLIVFVETFFASIYFGGVAFSQMSDIAGRVQVSEDDLRRRRLEESQIQKAFEQPPKITIGDLIPDLPDLGERAHDKIIPLQSVSFTPSSRILSSQELNRITARYTAREKVSLTELFEMVREIDALYDEKKVIGRATIPPQDVRSGTVTVELVEGRYGNIKIVQDPLTPKHRKTGRTIFDQVSPISAHNSLLHPFLMWGKPVYSALTFEAPTFKKKSQSSSKLRVGSLIRTEELENKILRFNMLYDAKLTAELEPGKNAGESDLVFKLHPAKPFDLAMWIDNFGRPSTGVWRFNSMLQLRNLTGLGDSWTANFVKSFVEEGTANAYVGGRIPIHRSGTMATTSFEYGNYSLVSGPFSVLEIDGWSRRSTFGLTQPLIVEQKRLLKAYLISSFYQSQNYFDGFPQQRSIVQSVTAGLTREKFGEKSYRMFDISFVSGVEVDARSNSQNYNLMRGSVLRVYKFSETWSILGRATGQWGWKTYLPSIEQFQMGGMSSVRGFTEGMLAGDSGYYLNGELHKQLFEWRGRSYIPSVGSLIEKLCSRDQSPNPCGPCTTQPGNSGYGHHPHLCPKHRVTSTLSTFAFVDHGGVFPFKGANVGVEPDDFLFSVGQGLNYSHGPHLQGRLTMSLPLRKNDLDLDYKSVRLNLFVQYQF